SSVITMNNGQTWDLMFFHSRGEKTDHMTWVKGESIAAQGEVLGEQSENLPEDLKKTITPDLTTMSAVSTDEGSFGATSGDVNDKMASLGIFQWAMLRNKADNTSSMAMFFKKLKERATAPITGTDPSDEQQLYIDAWKACTDKGLDIDAAGFITLHKHRATGGQVEAAMHGVLGHNNDLKTYQMVAGHDWIQDFKTDKVWPGPTGKGSLGHGFRYGKDSATFNPDKKHTIEVSAPGTASTVGDYFQSDKAVGMAVMLGVNRPHWVSFTIWRALDPAIDPKKRTGELLTALIDKMPKPSPGKSLTIDQSAAAAAGHDALLAYGNLQSFLWPAKRAVPNEDLFIAEFQRQAMSLYARTEKTDRHRQHRFSTIEGAFHQ
ncbi:MAG TPA: hypothetical protein VN824_21555, partial [Puia sp.]|nr:hypothetical protein [Puia sp.]